MGLEKNYGFRVGLEASYGDNSITALSAVPVFVTGRPRIAGAAIHERPIFNVNTFSRSPFVLGKAHWECDAEFYLKGSGTLGYQPEINRFLMMAGLHQRRLASTEMRYYPTTGSTTASGRCLVNLDGVEYALSGSRVSNLNIALEPGTPAKCRATIMALYQEPSVVSFDPTSNIWDFEETTNPPIVENVTMTLSSVTHNIARATFDLQNEMAVKESINTPNRGIKEIVTIGRNWSGSLLVERDSSNDIEWWTNYTDNLGLNLAMAAGWGPSTNHIEIQAFSTQIESIQPTVEKGHHYYDVKFRINTNTSNENEFRILFS